MKNEGLKGNNETVYKSPTIERIRGLNENLTQIKPLKNRQGDPSYMAPDIDHSLLPENYGATKIETAALVSLSAEDVWPRINRVIEEDQTDLKIDEQKLTKEPNLSRASVIKSSVVEFLRRRIINSLMGWNIEKENIDNGPESDLESPEDKRKRKIYGRYKELLLLGLSNVVDAETRLPTVEPFRHLGGGFETAMIVISDIIDLLPRVFKKQFGRNPTDDEFKKLCQGAKPLVLIIAKGDTNLLDSFFTTFLGSYKSDFNENDFFLAQRGAEFILEINTEKLDILEDSFTLKPVDFFRTGCPALVSGGTKGKNVISEIYDWYVKLYDNLRHSNKDE